MVEDFEFEFEDNYNTVDSITQMLKICHDSQTLACINKCEATLKDGTILVIPTPL